jgi:hypothetical protein
MTQQFGKRGDTEAITKEQRARLRAHLAKLSAACDMDADDQRALLISTSERLPVGDPLKAKVDDVLYRMANLIYLPEPDGTLAREGGDPD